MKRNCINAFLGTPLPLVVIPDFVDKQPVLGKYKRQRSESNSQEIKTSIESDLAGKEYVIPPGVKMENFSLLYD